MPYIHLTISLNLYLITVVKFGDRIQENLVIRLIQLIKLVEIHMHNSECNQKLPIWQSLVHCVVSPCIMIFVQK